MTRVEVNMATETKRWLTTAETAKLLRKALKAAFPGVKFSVRSDVYSGGSSIHVRWTEGPFEDEVERVAKVFEGKGFDGSIDLAYYIDHYIDADGNVGVLGSRGTEGSMGVVPGWSNELPAGAELVHLGAGFVFCTRDIHNEAQKLAMAKSHIKYHEPGLPDYRVDELAWRTVRGLRQGETIWQAYNRICVNG